MSELSAEAQSRPDMVVARTFQALVQSGSPGPLSSTAYLSALLLQSTVSHTSKPPLCA